MEEKKMSHQYQVILRSSGQIPQDLKTWNNPSVNVAQSFQLAAPPLVIFPIF